MGKQARDVMNKVPEKLAESLRTNLWGAIILSDNPRLSLRADVLILLT
jgi:hypothetical protein